MKRIIVTLVLPLMFLGCAEKGAPSLSGSEVVELSGEEAYEQVCASCHEEGLEGAPKTGDQDAWAGRSWLWETVLFEHARSGFEGMPAKGGDQSLDDDTVTKAAEHMMSLTYPDMPPG
jgi:cytochrome c5